MIVRFMLSFKSILPVLLAGAFLSLPQTGRAQQITYTGRAVAASVDVAGVINTSAADTGQLPPTGGSLSADLATVDLRHVLDVDRLTASTGGENSQTYSHASVSHVTVNTHGLYIEVSMLASNATANCSPNSATVLGTSTIHSLKVNGRPVKVTASPNQTIPLPFGSLILNEQISSVVTTPAFTTADILVNALHLKIGSLANVVISSSHSGVTCPNIVAM